MTVSDFIAAVRAEAAQLPFVTQVLLADQTDYAAKLILTIRPDLFIQMYANLEYDNQGGHPPHRHVREKREPYVFADVDRLVGDFLADVASVRSGEQ